MCPLFSHNKSILRHLAYEYSFECALVETISADPDEPREQ